MIPRYASFVFFVLFLFSLLIAFYTGIIDDNIQKVIFPAFSPYQLPALIIGNIPSLGKASADIIPPPPHLFCRENWLSPVILATWDLGRLELWDGLNWKGVYHQTEGILWPHYCPRAIGGGSPEEVSLL